MRCKFIYISLVVSIFSVEVVKNVFGRIVVKNCNDIVNPRIYSVIILNMWYLLLFECYYFDIGILCR